MHLLQELFNTEHTIVILLYLKNMHFTCSGMIVVIILAPIT